MIGQISPGELSEPHAQLEGPGNCLECHQSGRGVAAAACLNCHTILAKAITAGRGLHAAPRYRRCELCHIEHNGREFELVWWGDAGREAFDHDETGYSLEGAHGKLACGGCHKPESIVEPRSLLDHGKDLSRTFLGLETPCLTCHEDEHRGQVGAESCLECHVPTAWMPASRFDHSRAQFALTGRHLEVSCTKCHSSLTDAGASTEESYLQFPVAAFRRCTDCHRDPHEGRLGGDCQRCHSTSGWTGYDRGEFDHDRTEFPLEGEHRRILCESCHVRGSSFRVSRFAACTDCHGDDHLGQFAEPPTSGACEPCHTTDGFSPSTFDLSRHQESSYPLQGSHLASPCNACHRMVAVEELARHTPLPAASSEAQRPEAVTQFRFASTDCVTCHRDPHAGEVDTYLQGQGCESCHALEGWRQIQFDHDLTEFPLRGEHVGPQCQECHPRIEVGTSRERIGMAGASSQCSSCHLDSHFGQFVNEGNTARCQRCHNAENWKASLFDHSRDSVFPLEGAHLRVPCDGCHRAETAGEDSFVRYKPVPTRCEACHGDEIPAGRQAAARVLRPTPRRPTRG